MMRFPRVARTCSPRMLTYPDVVSSRRWCFLQPLRGRPKSVVVRVALGRHEHIVLVSGRCARTIEN